MLCLFPQALPDLGVTLAWVDDDMVFDSDSLHHLVLRTLLCLSWVSGGSLTPQGWFPGPWW